MGATLEPRAAAATRAIAVVQAAGRRVAIDGANVVQAVTVPVDLGAVPRRAGGLVGVLPHGDQLVPVVRLEDWLATADAPDADADADEGAEAAAPVADAVEARIVVLRDGGLLVGLRVDAVVGLQRCAATAVARLFHDERPDELFAGAVKLAGEAAPVALLEPARLAALAGVWCAAAGVSLDRPPAAGIDAAGEDVARGRVSAGVFRIGDRLVGLDVADIGGLVRTPALRPPPLRHASTRGLCDWRGRLLPVVDVGGLLGALPAPVPAPWMCVLRHGELALGVLVDEIVALHDARLALAAADDGALVRHELPHERGILQVLDTAALMAACPESAISRQAQAPARHGAQATSPHPWLVFEADGLHAARIEHVQEILPLPDALRPRLEAGLCVSFAWRGHAVPVRTLAEAAGRPPAEARLLMVVVIGDARVAVPIVAVRAMIAPRTATLARLRVRATPVAVISTAAGADRATYEVVDLEALALAAGAGRRTARDIESRAVHDCP